MGSLLPRKTTEPEEIDGYVALRKEVRVPISAGENDFGVQGFREMLRAGALYIVQPDASRAGGITEVHRIGKLAESFKARVATHTWSDAVAVVANMHVVAALPNGLSVEVDRTGNPFIDELLVEPLKIEDGCLRLSKAPGLGVEVDETVLRRFTLPADQHIPDGAYSDMSFGREYDFTLPSYEYNDNKQSHRPPLPNIRLPQKQIDNHLKLHYTTTSKITKAHQNQNAKMKDLTPFSLP